MVSGKFLMGFFKKIFGRRNHKKGNDDYDNNSQESAMTFIEQFKTLGDEKIEAYEKMLKEFKTTNEKQKLFLELIKEGIAYNKISKAQKIVNEYGQALMEATENKKEKCKGFYNNDPDAMKEFQEKGAIFYHLSGKFDIKYLPYDISVIEEAISILVKNETDKNRIDDLKRGLIYLPNFIDFSDFETNHS